MKVLLAVFGIFWGIVSHFIGFCYMSFLFLTGHRGRVRYSFPFIEVQVTHTGWFPMKWHTTHWGKFSGLNLGFFNFYNGGAFYNETTVKHEQRHGWQTSVLGPFYWLVYGGHCLALLFVKGKHPYFDNVLERDARRAAGQKV